MKETFAEKLETQTIPRRKRYGTRVLKSGTPEEEKFFNDLRKRYEGKKYYIN